MVDPEVVDRPVSGPARTTVVVGASSFGFGPAGVALNIAAALAARGVETLFVGDGAALELASRDPAQRVLRIPDGSEAARIEFLADALDRHAATAAVSSMSSEMVHAAKSRAVPSAWVESLLWWNSHPIEPVSISTDLYLHQRSLPDDQRLAAIMDARSKPVVSLGPITWPHARRRSPEFSHQSVVINVGGLQESAGHYQTLYRLYGQVISRVASRLREVLGQQSVVLVGPAWLTEGQAASHFDATPSQPRFVEMVSQADVLVTSPGLGAPFEAWTNGVPVVFLPPSNRSQVEQLRLYRTHALTRMRDDDIRAAANLTETYREIASPAGRDRLCTDLITEIQGATQPLPDSGIETYLRALGGTGTHAAAALIEQLARSGRNIPSASDRARRV